MFKNLGDKLAEKIGEIGDSVKEAIKAQSTPLDFKQFNNPIAEKTEWTPLKPGGTNFRTHKFSKEQGSAQFKATKVSLFFSGIFMLGGLLAPVLMMTSIFKSGSTSGSFPFIINLVPFLFFIVGFFLFRSSTKPIVFNKTTGYFWKGRLKKNENPSQKPLKVYCKLIDIVALQIVSERVRSSSSSSGSSSSFKSYEINLILQDASRLNVIDHGKRKKLMEDAEQLASYLGVPLWGGSRY